ncbi:MAG TPA: DUF2784 domain-containing protein [Burkholderiaceae bacterium]|jgi:hypothetical protein|nr:DUF2784 domain-containing protein [Burkholderiaceae bacterium]
MGARLAADAVVLLHLAFIAFAMLGGVLVAWRTRIAWLHLPAAAWGAWIEFSGAICPLTPLENHLRRMAGASGYAGGFVERYLIPIVYPAGLTAQAQQWLGVLVVVVNLAIYLVVAGRWSRTGRCTR